MDKPGYAIIQPDEGDWTDGGPGLQRDALTRRLGCTDTTVDRYLTRGGASATLPADREQLCVPLDGDGTLNGAGTRRLEPHALALVPCGTAAEIGSDESTRWLVVGAPPEPGTGASQVFVDVADLSFEVPTTSPILTVRLTDRLD